MILAAVFHFAADIYFLQRPDFVIFLPVPQEVFFAAVAFLAAGVFTAGHFSLDFRMFL